MKSESCCRERFPIRVRAKRQKTMTSSLPAEGDRIERSPDEWREKLTPEQFQVARQGGTERAFTGAYWNHKDDGMYHCICCDAPLFSSSTKFESGTGWPSFWDGVSSGAIRTKEDRTHGMVRTEILCADVMPIWDTCSPMDRHRQGSVTASTVRPQVQGLGHLQMIQPAGSTRVIHRLPGRFRLRVWIQGLHIQGSPDARSGAWMPAVVAGRCVVVVSPLRGEVPVSRRPDPDQSHETGSPRGVDRSPQPGRSPDLDSDCIPRIVVHRGSLRRASS